MSPTLNDTGKIYDLAKGSIRLGNLNMAWDFTEGKTKAQFITDFERKNSLNIPSMYVLKSGRIIMPQLNII